MAVIKVSSEIHSPLTQEQKWAMPTVWDCLLTVAEVNGTAQAGTVVVPGVVGKQFVPTDVWMKSIGGTATGASLVLVQVATTAGSPVVIESHAKADLTDGTWVGRTGGTVVITGLGWPCVSGDGLRVMPTGGDITSGTVTFRALIKGFYIPA